MIRLAAFRSTAGLALLMVASAAVIVLVETVLRGILPPSLGPLASLVGFGAGLVVGHRILAQRVGASTPDLAVIPAADVTDHGDVFATDTMSEAAGADSEPAPIPGGEIVTLPAFGLGDAGNVHVERAISELAAYPTFTEILKKQMGSVTELSDQAANSILTNLNGVDGRITALLNFIKQSESTDQVSRIVSQIEAEMDGCRHMLDDFAERQATDAQLAFQQLGKMTTDTQGVLDVIQGVNGIARQTSMLSLNVSIEAARAGEAGRGFAIIGNEIRSLAARVQDLSNEVHQRVESLMQTVTVDLEQQAKLREQSQRDAIANITATLGALTENLLTVVTYNRDVMHKVETESAAIGGPIMDIMAGLQFQDIIRQQLEQLDQMAGMVDSHLQSVGAGLANHEDGQGEATLLSKLDGQYGNYVMARQRQTHLEALGQGQPQAAVSLIELF
jgi:hypothetical protein